MHEHEQPEPFHWVQPQEGRAVRLAWHAKILWESPNAASDMRATSYVLTHGRRVHVGCCQ